MTIEEMKINIQNGINWLNENRPGWQDKIRRKIKVNEFDMIMPCGCIIGTTDGSFDKVFPNWGWKEDTEQPIELGFALPFMDDEDEAEVEYAKLTQLWIEVVKK